MTEIQEIIANLQSKVKRQTDDLTKMEQELACLRSLISNDRHALQKIVDGMATSVKEETYTNELAG